MSNKYLMDVMVDFIWAISSFENVNVNLNGINPERVYVDTRSGEVKVKFYDFSRAKYIKSKWYEKYQNIENENE